MSHKTEKEWLELAIPIVIRIEAKLRKGEKLTKEEERDLKLLLGVKKLKYEEQREIIINHLWERLQFFEGRLEEIREAEEVRIFKTSFMDLDRVADGYQEDPEQIFAKKEVKSLIAKELEKLTEREKKVLVLRYGLEDGIEHTLERIGERFNLSRERIRQIETFALRKLAYPAKKLKLGDFIPSFQEETEIKRKDVEKIIEFPDDLGFALISTNVNEELIRYFFEHPEEMKTMNRRLFEEMIAELFDGFGFNVELMKQTRDGGRDIIAIRYSQIAEKFIIEAKRPKPGKPVGVVPVRALYGVKHFERATKAILATTTYFTRDAKVLFRENLWELEPKEYADIIKWINEYLKLKRD